ncbi:MAG TPA: hypothetical protein VFQ77_03275, partial [Pseudonocardiaceae bacterium]|nr:hypothetical protein [Pseudonocardiaceae bacterium]
PSATPTRGLIRQQRLQSSPFLIGQIMAIKHPEDLSYPPTEIHGTRSSPQTLPKRASCRFLDMRVSRPRVEAQS